MQTRSQTKLYRENRDRLIAKYTNIVLETVVYTETTKHDNRDEYTVDIDFDGASEAWLANKTRQSNATYKYKCLGQTKTRRSCKRTPIEHTDYCSCHGK
jgi:hypothetical protein